MVLKVTVTKNDIIIDFNDFKIITGRMLDNQHPKCLLG